jgi:GAF domain-containing protein
MTWVPGHIAGRDDLVCGPAILTTNGGQPVHQLIPRGGRSVNQAGLGRPALSVSEIRALHAGVHHRQASPHARRDPGAALGEITLVFVEVQIRSALNVPVELGGGPIGTLDVYAAEPRGLGRQRGHSPADLCRGGGQPAPGGR